MWRSLDDAQMLRVEEALHDDEVVVRAEMPGIDPDKDVDITVSDHVLRIRAERREESKSEEKGTYRSEFRYGELLAGRATAGGRVREGCEGDVQGRGPRGAGTGRQRAGRGEEGRDRARVTEASTLPHAARPATITRAVESGPTRSEREVPARRRGAFSGPDRTADLARVPMWALLRLSLSCDASSPSFPLTHRMRTRFCAGVRPAQGRGSCRHTTIV